MNTRSVVRLIVDDSGQDLIEYALLSGMVAVGTMLFVLVTLLLMRFRYISWQNGAQAAWEPCPPGGC